MRYAIVCVLVVLVGCPQRSPGIEEMQRKRAERRAYLMGHGDGATRSVVAARQTPYEPPPVIRTDPEPPRPVDFGGEPADEMAAGPFYCHLRDDRAGGCYESAPACVTRLAAANEQTCQPRAEAWCFGRSSDSGRIEICRDSTAACAAAETRSRVELAGKETFFSCRRVAAAVYDEAAGKDLVVQAIADLAVQAKASADREARLAEADARRAIAKQVEDAAIYCTMRSFGNDSACWRGLDACDEGRVELDEDQWDACYLVRRAACFTYWIRLERRQGRICSASFAHCEGNRKVIARNRSDFSKVSKCAPFE